MFSTTAITAFRPASLPDRIDRILPARRRRVALGTLLERLYRSDAYRCHRAQGRRIAARAMRDAVISRWSLS